MKIKINKQLIIENESMSSKGYKNGEVFGEKLGRNIGKIGGVIGGGIIDGAISIKNALNKRKQKSINESIFIPDINNNCEKYINGQYNYNYDLEQCENNAQNIGAMSSEVGLNVNNYYDNINNYGQNINPQR